jgi:TRAP-type mannitol/chloroaromatic compound transport system permease large subunit
VPEFATLLDILMFVTAFAVLLTGVPVALALAGTALAFAGLGWAFGVFNPSFVGFLPQRIFGAMTNEVLLAVPLFVFMGVMLERSKVAEDLLTNLGRLFGPMPGGLGLSVTAVGALLAASTGIVGATVVTMGLLSLPTMLRHGYRPSLACGSICAAGTLGQIIPPSIVLVLLGDALSTAYQNAQLSQGIFAPDTVSVGDLFAGALLPGLLLVGLYAAWQGLVAAVAPDRSPPLKRADGREGLSRAAMWLECGRALLPPLFLMIAVLGSILAGIATTTEAAAVGAVGALLLAGQRVGGRGGPAIPAGIAAFGLLVALGNAADLRLAREDASALDSAAIVLAGLLCAAGAAAMGLALWRVWQARVLAAVLDSTARITAMVFTIVIAAALFSLVFRGLGGDHTVTEALSALPGGTAGAVIVVMAAMFLMGFFLDFVEIVLIVVPIVAPVLLAMGLDPVWLGVMMAINLQTSFLTPPFGFALFYLRGVAPETVRTTEIYRGVAPFVAIQLAVLAIVAAAPAIATWLPGVVFPG